MKKYLLQLLFLFCTSLNASAQFITIWKTDNPGSAGNQLILPINGANYEIKWWLTSDSLQVNGTTIATGDNYVLLLPQAGTYGVAIEKGDGMLNYIRFHDARDYAKLVEIKQWGNHPWTTMEGAFRNCRNLTITATDVPNLTQVTTTAYMFRNCSAITTISTVQKWNVSNVTNMEYMFYSATAFNQSLNDWDVGNVTNMEYMFYSATAFNQLLNDWDVGNVTNMEYMFYSATAFNQSLNDWDVGNVTNMENMFYRATAFNQSLNDWDVSNVTNMSHMFTYTYNFNQPLDKWNVSNVTNMESMFYYASAFNQSLNDWDVSKVTTMKNMFTWDGNFDQPLNKWDVSNVTDMNSMFYRATNFDQSLTNWNVSKVTNMSHMFQYTSNFNQPLDKWNVDKVTNMEYMFDNATAFNQSLNDWNVSKVTTMRNMFSWAGNFNQPLNKWNVSNVISLFAMFYGATSFNKSLNEWDVSNVTNMSNMFSLSGIDCANITYTLKGWAAKSSTPNNITLEAAGVNYAPEAVDALNTLRNDKNWTITIGSEVECEALPVTLIHFKARNLENTVVLDWSTTEEKEHDYFEVQRSHDAKKWVSIGRIAGMGTTQTIQHYQFTDDSPFPGTSYYRLQIVATSGTREYSSYLSVQTQDEEKIVIYPNPTTTHIQFSKYINGTLQILNTQGQVVKESFVDESSQPIDVNSLPEGSYLLRINNHIIQRFLKVNHL